MKPLESFRSRLVPLPSTNVDTDQITPARFLKVTERGNLGNVLFHDWRFDQAGNPRPEFVLNQPRSRGAQVLLAGDNFGCGSSREHAPWALVDFGFRAVVSTSFADIFCSNSLKNGLLPIVVDAATQRELFDGIVADPDAEVHVDLASQTLTLPSGRKVTFPIDPFSKKFLLEGIDELGYLLKHEGAIAQYESLHAG